jgi:hypothetical protein
VLTIFSTTKRFEGLFDVIQRNAIRSWTLLHPAPQVLIFGDDPGTAEACRDLGVEHRPEVATNEFGTPLVSDMFLQAQKIAVNPNVCFVNADVILTDETMRAADRVSAWSNRFLIVGRRLDVDITDLCDFDDPTWQSRLKERARRDGELKSEVWIDWFLFPRGLFTVLPEFAIGRSGYDNWLLWRASSEGVPLIDATAYVPLIHQRHDYSHAGGKTRVWEGEEARRAHELVGHWTRYYSVSHARYMLTPSGEVVPARGLRYRLARPRRLASHLLRFTRPLRRRLQGERATWRRRKV